MKSLRFARLTPLFAALECRENCQNNFNDNGKECILLTRVRLLQDAVKMSNIWVFFFYKEMIGKTLQQIPGEHAPVGSGPHSIDSMKCFWSKGGVGGHFMTSWFVH